MIEPTFQIGEVGVIANRGEGLFHDHLVGKEVTITSTRGKHRAKYDFFIYVPDGYTFDSDIGTGLVHHSALIRKRYPDELTPANMEELKRLLNEQKHFLPSWEELLTS